MQKFVPRSSNIDDILESRITNSHSYNFTIPVPVSIIISILFSKMFYIDCVNLFSLLCDIVYLLSCYSAYVCNLHVRDIRSGNYTESI